VPEANFKCLRCGNEWTQSYDPALEPVERACPKCHSNSVRPLTKLEEKKQP
jgi:Zn finger protein HypA/HybF involved in hydrogenase expression